MKKVIGIIAAVLVIAAIGVGGFFIYMKLTSPEIALAATVADVKKNGIQGLEGHVTDEAMETIETAQSVAEKVGVVAGLLSSISGDDTNKIIGVILDKIKEIKWEVEDVLRGKKSAEVRMKFTYEQEFSGTIDITMIRDGRSWKINGIGVPMITR